MEKQRMSRRDFISATMIGAGILASSTERAFGQEQGDHPTPWHNWNNMTLTASFTFHEPFTLPKGEEVCLSYRVVVHAGDAKKADVEKLWKAFSRADPVRA